ncbi:hypothetical protein J2W37_001267 [Variovorax paradoxus]|uniref:STM4504/CBY_0614 family protein n=1 Tax=Variovorax paradoxus TaxID=34073 RepID=UPI002780170C|nr:hypothetical protein [Variovorax paradoxus]MDP9963556.1 hypothetical protein [Variovorax paradoxus]
MVFDLYSKRKRQLNKEAPDIFTYERFPQAFRVQVIYLWNYGFGDYSSPDIYEAYATIVKILREETGRFALIDLGYNGKTSSEELQGYLLSSIGPDQILDVLELSFKVMNGIARKPYYAYREHASKFVDKAIDDLNIRFREHNIGYQFTNDEIVRIDSELIHAEVVKPTLKLLSQPHFKGAQEEYLKAHEHYRHGNAKEALNECLKAFESAMMSICQKRGWSYGPKDNAKTLIGICFANHLIPTFWESEMTGLRALLEGGVPTGRNKLAGHGQGAEPVSVPPHIVSYIMHMTAANLKFLAEADAALG